MTLSSCILFFSMLNQIDPAITKAVIDVESSFNTQAVGSVGEVGLMQIRAKYVAYSDLQLFIPCTNVMVGTKLLRKAKKSFPLYVDYTYVSSYNLGISGMKRIKHPTKFPYYLKIKKRMK